MSHEVCPQCIPLIPTATGNILTDKDRIGKYFVQDSQKVEREEGKGWDVNTGGGKKTPRKAQ